MTAELAAELNRRAEAKVRREGQSDEALRLNDMAFEVAKIVDSQAVMARCYQHRGFIYYHQSKPSEAMENYQRALSLLREAKDKGGEAITLNLIGNIHILLNEYEKALENFSNPQYRVVKRRGS